MTVRAADQRTARLSLEDAGIGAITEPTQYHSVRRCCMRPDQADVAGLVDGLTRPISPQGLCKVGI
jgi:hypothetical protein